jgi:hypothetical protein
MPNLTMILNSPSPPHAAYGRGSDSDDETNYFTSPTPEDPDLMQIEEISDYPDTPTRKSKATAARDFTDTLIENVFNTCQGADEVQQYQQLYDTLSVKSSPVLAKLIDLGVIYDKCKYKPDDLRPRQIVFNLKHILTVDQCRGYHYVQKGSSVKLENVIKSTHAPYQATFTIPNGKKKISTIFPEDLIPDTKELLNTISTACVIAEDQNRRLLMTKHKFAIETTYKGDRVLGTTAYPIFFFDVYIPGREYEIVENTPLIPADELLTKAQQHFKATPVNTLVKYEVGSKLKSIIVDMASLLKIGVDKGIYIQFPKAFVWENT